MADTPQTIAADKLCALTGLTDRRHRQLADQGFFPPPADGEYLLVPTLRGLFNFYREGRKETRDEYTNEKIGLARAQKENWQLLNKKRAGMQIDIEDALALVQKFTFAVRQKIVLSHLDDSEKNSVLMELQGIKDVDFTEIETEDVEPSKVAS